MDVPGAREPMIFGHAAIQNAGEQGAGPIVDESDVRYWQGRCEQRRPQTEGS